MKNEWFQSLTSFWRKSDREKQQQQQHQRQHVMEWSLSAPGSPNNNNNNNGATIKPLDSKRQAQQERDGERDTRDAKYSSPQEIRSSCTVPVSVSLNLTRSFDRLPNLYIDVHLTLCNKKWIFESFSSLITVHAYKQKHTRHQKSEREPFIIILNCLSKKKRRKCLSDI